MTKSIGIIGAGIVGLSTAYYLSRAGCQVTLIDKGELSDGCSFGNAGMIVPSHFIPLAAPGMIAKGIRWMFNSKSPFYVKPRLSADLLRWGYLFYRHSTRAHVEKSAPALRDISLMSKALYAEWKRDLPFDFGYHERGLVMMYQTAAAEHEEGETALEAKRLGIDAKVLSPQEVQSLEPDVSVNVRGGVYFPGDTHLTPHVMVRELIAFLRQKGVRIVSSAEIDSIDIANARVCSIRSGNQVFTFDEYVLATGSWSGLMASRLDLKLPMQAGKGYSFLVDQVAKNIRVPSILLEARVAVTPMGNSVRFGGTMEIGGINHEINPNRVKGIVEAIPKYYPDWKFEYPQKVWHGLRPCSPDGLPYIGRLQHLPNVVVATGHSMMGMSLGPATGKLVSDLIQGRALDMSLGAFDPQRFR